MSDNVQNFLDEQGRVTAWPKKYKNKIIVVEYLSTKFKLDEKYTEKEVNEILNKWHTFNDYFLLRKELIMKQHLDRLSDCSSYWKIEKKEELK